MKLEGRVEIPPDVWGRWGREQEFLYPWFQCPGGAPPAPVPCRNYSWGGGGVSTQLKVGTGEGGIHLSVAGDVVLGRESTPEGVRSTLARLPELWSWGRNVRRMQDARYERLRRAVGPLFALPERLRERDRLKWWSDSDLEEMREQVSRILIVSTPDRQPLLFPQEENLLYDLPSAIRALARREEKE